MTREQIIQQVATVPPRSRARYLLESRLREATNQALWQECAGEIVEPWRINTDDPGVIEAPAYHNDRQFYAWLILLVVSVATSAAIVAAMLWR